MGTTFQVAWTSDGLNVVRVARDGLYFYNMSTLAKQKFIEVPEIYMPDYLNFTFVRYNAKSQIVVRCNALGDFDWWNVADGEVKHLGEIDSIYRDDPTQSVTAVEFSPDGKMFAVGGIHGEVLIYNLFSSKPSSAIQLIDPQWAGPFGISSNSKLLAKGSSDGFIRLWDVSTQEFTGQLREAQWSDALATYQGYAANPSIISFIPGGQLLAWATKDNTVRLGDVTTGQTLFTLSGHTAEIWNLTFSPNGQLLASGSEDGTIRLWDVTTGKLLQTLSAKAGPVYTLAFNPDGRLLASGHKNATVVWGIKP